VGGAQAIAQALTTRVAHLRLGAHIRSVRRQANTVLITMEDGNAETFDFVVFATQANQVMAMMDDASPTERSVLGAVRYGTVRVVMHHDTRLMPTEAPTGARSTTCWRCSLTGPWSASVNCLLPAYQDTRPLFQTINPLVNLRLSW
jgi:predicted NAD/FAD-binding protein